MGFQMAIEVFLIGKNDISCIGLTHILKSGGFEQVELIEGVVNIQCEAIGADSLVIIDCLSQEEQLATLEEIKTVFPASKVVVLFEDFNVKAMLECFNAGAQAYIVKSMKSARLIAALRLAALGEKVVPSEFVDVLGSQGVDLPVTSEVEREIEGANISPREFDVLCCLMAGYPNKVIARKLDVCEATVKVHVKAILRKLNVRNRTQAAVWAKTRGIGVASLDASPNHR